MYIINSRIVKIKIYSYWNVNKCTLSPVDAGGENKIYSYWNVNKSNEEKTKETRNIKIYPEWNVNVFSDFTGITTESYLNLPRVECKLPISYSNECSDWN